jgi:ferric-dicitrate binding protein FerR (iron transport regulator)
MADLKDILSEQEEHANEEELMKYLDGNLSEDEKYAFETKTSNSDFVNDAVEGLNQFKSKEKLNDYVEQLNKNLHKQLDSRKKRKEQRRIKDNAWIWLAIVLILGLIIIAFVILRMQHKADRLKTAKYSIEMPLKV